ncbi:MAG: holo-ACP synthase [Bacteroidales bacterium]
MILGIGTDIIDNARIERYLSRNELLKNRLFSKAEQEYCDSKAKSAEHYAARFAAKEAFFKALGTGYRYGMAFHEIEVMNDELGKPFIQLSGKAQEFADNMKVKTVHISISHLKDIASAFVVLEG